MKYQQPLTVMAKHPAGAGFVMPMVRWDETGGHATITLTRSHHHPTLTRSATDPVVVAASIVVTLQTVANGDTAPSGITAVDIESLQAGHATHPDTCAAWATLELRVRARSPQRLSHVAQRMQVAVQAQAERYGYAAQITWAPDHRNGGAGNATHD